VLDGPPTTNAASAEATTAPNGSYPTPTRTPPQPRRPRSERPKAGVIGTIYKLATERAAANEWGRLARRNAGVVAVVAR